MVEEVIAVLALALMVFVVKLLEPLVVEVVVNVVLVIVMVQVVPTLHHQRQHQLLLHVLPTMVKHVQETLQVVNVKPRQLAQLFLLEEHVL